MAEAICLSISLEVWTAHKNTFNHHSKAYEIRLKDDLQLMKHDTRSVTIYIHEFKTIYDQFCSIGRLVDGIDKFHWFLYGLDTISSLSLLLRWPKHTSLFPGSCVQG